MNLRSKTPRRASRVHCVVVLIELVVCLFVSFSTSAGLAGVERRGRRRGSRSEAGATTTLLGHLATELPLDLRSCQLVLFGVQGFQGYCLSVIRIRYPVPRVLFVVLCLVL